MSVDSELTLAENAALAGPSMPRYFVVYDKVGSNVVATARVNGTVGYPLITVPVDGTSAGWSNVARDMAILIGSTPGGFDRGIYRVRDTGTGSTLEIMAIAQNDSGEVTFVTRDTGITDDDYITVLYRLDIFGANPRIDYSGVGVDAPIYNDWDKAYDGSHETPPPLVNVFIKGRPENYATHVYSATSDTFDIDLAIELWPTSASATWAITLPAGVTLNSGSLTGSGLTATINVTAPHSPDPYVFKFVATEDNGFSFTAYRKAWITSNTYPPIRVVRVDMDEDDITGSRRSITVERLTDLAPGGMVHLFDMGNWNGVDVPSAIHAFTGYVIGQKEATDIGLSSVTLDLVGPSYMLEQIGGQSQILSVVDTPATWQEIVAELSYLDAILWLYLYERVTGLLQMYNCTLFGLSNTEKRMTGWYIDTGTLLAQVQAQAKRIIGGNFGCDPGGEIMLRVKPSRVWGDRSGIPTRCTLTENKYTHIDQGAETRPRVRRLRTEAFYSDAVTTTPIWSDAPQIPGQGQAEEKLDRLIVDSPTELYQGTGLEYAARNNRYPSGSTRIEKNYAVIKPAQMLRVYQSTGASLRYDQAAWAIYTLVTRVSRTHNPDGTIDTALSWEAETSGVAGVDAPIPVPDASQLQSRYQATRFAPIPLRRRANPNPAGTKKGAQVIPRDGSVHFCGTATKAFVAMNFLGTPAYRDVTPSGLGNFQIQHGMIQIGGARAWLLVSDGTDSKVYTTANVFALPRPTWSAGTAYTGVYTLLRTTSVAGSILIYQPGVPASTTYDFNFSLFDQGFVNSDGVSTYSSGAWRSGIDSGSARLNIRKSFSPAVNLVSVRVIGSAGAIAGGGTRQVAYDAGAGGLLYGTLPTTSGAIDTTITSSVAGVIDIFISIDNNLDVAENTITRIVVVVSDTSTDTYVRHSSDNGATFGSAVLVGNSPGTVGGFDTPRTGTVSYASAATQIKKAATHGGAYSNASGGGITGASANMIEVPWYTRNSNTATNGGSSPEFIFGTPIVDGSGKTLYWVVGGTPVDITPTNGGNQGASVSANNLTTWKGKYMAGIFDFAGTRRIATSKDGGSSWSNRGTASGATYIRVRRLAKTPGQLYIAGSGILQYSPDFGATRVNKTAPSASALVFFEPVG